MKQKMWRTIKHTASFLLLILALWHVTPQAFAVVNEQKSKQPFPSPYIPSEFILEYEAEDGHPAIGSAIKDEHQKITEALTKTFGFKFQTMPNGKQFRAIHEETIIQKMIQKNMTEEQIVKNMFQELKTKKSRASIPSNKFDKYRFSHELLFRLDLNKLPSGAKSVLDVIQMMKANSRILVEGGRAYRLRVSPHGYATIQYIPNDTRFPEQWALNNTGQTGGTPDADIDAPEAWDISQGSGQAVIAVVDTGVDYTHQDLAQNIWVNPGEDLNHNGIVDASDFNNVDDDNNGYTDDIRGWDFVEDAYEICDSQDDCNVRDNDPSDVHGHGTHVSGTVAAVTGNGEGIAGTCPNCKVMSVRAGFVYAGVYGVLLDADVEAAILYAVQNGADVISMSFGSNYTSPYRTALQLANATGVLLVAAAGNSGMEAPFYPAAFPEVISVAAIDANGSRSIWPSGASSNYGEWVDIAAPGTAILSTLPQNHVSGPYRAWSGTSMATPHVAGVAGLIRSVQPNFTSEQIKQLLLNSTTPFVNEPDHPIGRGIVNAFQAARIAGGEPTVIVTEHSVSEPYIFSNREWEMTLHVQLFNMPTPFSAVLSTDNSNIQILKPESVFEEREAPGFAENDNDRFRLLYTGEEILFGDVNFHLQISSSDLRTNFQVPFKIQQLPGWPFNADPSEFDRPVSSSPAIADLDGDGSLEVAIGGQNGKFFILDSGGGIRSSTGLSPLIAGSPAIADITGDGTPEIIIGYPTSTSTVGRVRALRPDGLALWSTDVDGLVYASPAVGDIDGEAGMEIVVGTWAGKIYALRRDGTVANGAWPVDVGVQICSTAVIANIDQANQAEIIVGDCNGRMHVLNSDGTPFSNAWPKQIFSLSHRSSPAVADLDPSVAGLEIIFTGGSGNRIYAFHNDGSAVHGWEEGVEIANDGFSDSSPAVANIDQDRDGTLEVIVGSNTSMYVFHSDGTLMEGAWPIRIGARVQSSPAVADIDLTHAGLEIVVGADDGKLYAWSADGMPLSGWPLQTNGPILSSPAIADLNADGHFEIIVGSDDEHVYAWTLPYVIPSSHPLPWPMFRQNPQRTGFSAEGHTVESGLLFDRSLYCSSQGVVVYLIDSGLNLNPDLQGTVVVQVSSQAEPNPENITLIEIDDNSGSFSGNVAIDLGVPAQDGILQINQNDVITVRYQDVSSGLIREDTAEVDVSGPPEIVAGSVSGMYTQPSSSSQFQIDFHWQTNELSNGRIFLFVSNGRYPERHVDDYFLGTNHSVRLGGMGGGGYSSFAIESTDVCGNRVYDDNGGNLYEISGGSSFIRLTLLNATVPPNGVNVTVRDDGFLRQFAQAPTNSEGQVIFNTNSFSEHYPDRRYRLAAITSRSSAFVSAAFTAPADLEINMNNTSPSMTHFNLYQEGAAVPGADIEVLWGQADPFVLRTVWQKGNLKTDSTGHAYLNLPANEQFKICARHELNEQNCTDFFTAPANVTLNLNQTLLTFHRGGVPIENAEINIMKVEPNGYSSVGRRAFTDVNGRVSFALQSGITYFALIRYEPQDQTLYFHTDHFVAPTEFAFDLNEHATQLYPIEGDIKLGEIGDFVERRIRANTLSDEPIQLTALNLPPGATFTPDDGYNSATFRWVPNCGDAGEYPVNFRAVNSIGQDEDMLRVVINDANCAPDLNLPATAQIAINRLLTFDISASDREGDEIYFDTYSMPTGAAFTDQGNGTGTFSWRPQSNQVGFYSVGFVACDNVAQYCNERTVGITVTRGGNPPQFDTVPDQSATVGQQLEFTVRATDIDGDPIRLYAEGIDPNNEEEAALPLGVSFLDHGNGTGIFSWTPTVNQRGHYGIRFVAIGATSERADVESITIAVVGRPPELNFIPNQSARFGGRLSFTISATDSDQDPITITVANLPGWLSIVDHGNGTAIVSGTAPRIPDRLSYIFTVTATDSENLTDSQEVEVKVTVNDTRRIKRSALLPISPG